MKVIIAIALSLWMLTLDTNAQGNLSEAEVAHVLRTVNDTEIDIAKLAKRKANNTHVKGFADLMETAHIVNNEEHRIMIKEAQIKLENNSVSKTMRIDSKNKIKQLKKQSDSKAFDRIFVEHQVLLHQHLLEDLDQKYIPNQQDARFKVYLEKTREHILSHYNQAVELQAKIEQ